MRICYNVFESFVDISLVAMKSINRKVRKGLKLRSQRTELEGFGFAFFAFITGYRSRETDLAFFAVKKISDIQLTKFSLL
jgi:hypothetical protein